MDSLRVSYADHEDDEGGHELPPMAIGHAERRLQVRAYNFWAALLGERRLPPARALDTGLPDFAPLSALLDFGEDRDDPAIRHIGAALLEEAGATQPIARLSQTPERSLLSRIAGHYRQIFDSQAPVGFEAEFVNWRGATILYRGILLPFSAEDDGEIAQVLCVINWKEVLETRIAAELQQQIAQSLEPLRRLRLVPAEADDVDAAGAPALPAHAEPAEEFCLLLARRLPNGEMAMVGTLPHDARLIERATRLLLLD